MGKTSKTHTVPHDEYGINPELYTLLKYESHFTKSNSLFVQTYLANKT